MEFVNTLCPEFWNVEAGRLTHQGRAAVVDDAFLDAKPKPTSHLASRKASPAIIPAASAFGTPATSGDEAGAGTPGSGPTTFAKKTKLTRNRLRAKEEGRRQTMLEWLTFGGPNPHSDSEPDVRRPLSWRTIGLED